MGSLYTSRMLARMFPVLLLAACAAPAPDPAPEQPMLAQLALPYARQMREVGISRVVSSGAGAMVRLETSYGAVYLEYPRDVPPVAFVLDIESAAVRASSMSFDRERDARVLGTILPAAIQETASNNSFQWLRANPWH